MKLYPIPISEQRDDHVIIRTGLRDSGCTREERICTECHVVPGSPLGVEYRNTCPKFVLMMGSWSFCYRD